MVSSGGSWLCVFLVALGLIACRSPDPSASDSPRSPSELRNGCACWHVEGCGKGGQALGWDHMIDPERSQRPLAREILRAMSLKSGQRLLDVGAGFGFWTLQAAEGVGSDGSVVAVDDNPYCAELMDLAFEVLGMSNVEVRNSRFEELDQPAQPFDVILCKNALRFPSHSQAVNGVPGEQSYSQRLVRQFWKQLVPGGRVVMVPIVRPDDCLPASDVVHLFEETGFRILSEEDPRTLGLSIPETSERCGTLLVAQKP